MSGEPRDRLVFALDVATPREAEHWVWRLKDDVGCFKIGLELFLAAGPPLIRSIAARAPVFLDLKLHDIPATVERATRQACALGVRYLTVHIGDATSSLAGAIKACASATTILGITVLTSVADDDLISIGYGQGTRELVLERAEAAWKVGCRGVVCSPLELQELRAHLGADMLLVTPGIRSTNAEMGDQRRVMGPAEAVGAGADLIVVGRPIRDAHDPIAAARQIVSAIAEGEEVRSSQWGNYGVST